VAAAPEVGQGPFPVVQSGVGFEGVADPLQASHESVHLDHGAGDLEVVVARQGKIEEEGLSWKRRRTKNGLMASGYRDLLRELAGYARNTMRYQCLDHDPHPPDPAHGGSWPSASNGASATP